MKVCSDFYTSDLHRVENCSACQQLTMKIKNYDILDDISELLQALKKRLSYTGLKFSITEAEQAIKEIDQMQQRIAATKGTTDAVH